MKHMKLLLLALVLFCTMFLVGAPTKAAPQEQGFRYINISEWRDLGREFVNQTRSVNIFCSQTWWAQSGGLGFVRAYSRGNTCTARFDYFWLDLYHTRSGGPAVMKICSHPASFLTVNGSVMRIPGAIDIYPSFDSADWLAAISVTPCQPIGELSLKPAYATALAFAVQHALRLNPSLRERFGDVGLDPQGVPLPAPARAVVDIGSVPLHKLAGYESQLSFLNLSSDSLIPAHVPLDVYDLMDTELSMSPLPTYPDLATAKSFWGVTQEAWLADSLEQILLQQPQTVSEAGGIPTWVAPAAGIFFAFLVVVLIFIILQSLKKRVSLA